MRTILIVFIYYCSRLKNETFIVRNSIRLSRYSMAVSREVPIANSSVIKGVTTYTGHGGDVYTFIHTVRRVVATSMVKYFKECGFKVVAMVNYDFYRCCLLSSFRNKGMIGSSFITVVEGLDSDRNAHETGLCEMRARYENGGLDSREYIDKRHALNKMYSSCLMLKNTLSKNEFRMYSTIYLNMLKK